MDFFFWGVVGVGLVGWATSREYRVILSKINFKMTGPVFFLNYHKGVWGERSTLDTYLLNHKGGRGWARRVPGFINAIVAVC